MSELARRILFAVAAIPIAIAIIWFGDAALAALLGVIAAIGAWELFRIARAGGATPLERVGIPIAAAVPLIVHAHRLGIADARFDARPQFGDGLGQVVNILARGIVAPFTLSLTGAAVVVLVIFSIAIWSRGVEGKPLTGVAVTVFGIIYTGGMLSYGYAIRYHPYAVGPAAGTVLIFLPLLLTWAQDTGAYAVGRTMGRHKLIPRVSPGKTVEGAIGGIIVTVLVCWLYVRFALVPYAQLALSPTDTVVFAILISIAAQIGDLAESLIKREAGVKDSSRIIPGHGGVLDRFDSLLFVLPIAYLLLGVMLIPAPGSR
jgi:phosphatidate cytidylyltransferase